MKLQPKPPLELRGLRQNSTPEVADTFSRWLQGRNAVAALCVKAEELTFGFSSVWQHEETHP